MAVSGKFNKIIVLERLETKPNRFGEIETTGYVPYCRTKAQISFNGDNKTDLGTEITFINDMDVILRFYFKDIIKTDDRIIYLEKPYEIMTVQPDEDNRLLILKCREWNE